jgi:AraC-like DNA-binding protein
MVLARSTLRREDLSLAQVAEQVGYVSEAAFSRAFKRYAGATPALWRRQLRQAAAAPS